MFKAQIFKVSDLALKHKSQWVWNTLASSSLKELFARVKSLSAPDVRCLPTYNDDNLKLTHDISTFFKSKVDLIVSDFTHDTPPQIRSNDDRLIKFDDF